MNPEHKIWAVIQAVVDALDLAPKEKPVEITPTTLKEFVNKTELKQILHKLTEDEKIIEILYEPDVIGSIRLDGDSSSYQIKIPDQTAFQAYYDKAHFKFFGSLEKLTGEKFLAVSDVTQDIFEKLSVSPSNEVYIPIARDIIRYQILYPGHSVNMMDRYCNLRMEATLYLQENGHIESHSVTREGWKSTITITVNRLKFTKFYTKLVEIHPKKIKQDGEEKKDKDKVTENSESIDKIMHPPTINIFNNNQQNNTVSDGDEEKNKQKTQNSEGSLCPNTKWENITIEFLNGHDVRIKYDSQSIDSNYVKMGFEDSKKKKPNTQWNILEHMSNHERFVSFNDVQPILCKDLKSQKKELSQKLKDFFGIKDDPFEYIKSEIDTGYLAKFQITAEGQKTKTYLGNY